MNGLTNLEVVVNMKVVLTGGGTAGHVFPAMSVATYLKENYDVELHYIGNKNFIEAKIAMEHHIPFYSISSQGLEGSNPLKKYANFALKNGKGTLEALKLLKEIKPDFVFATGGFVSAPVLAACQLLNIPYSIHEQNSVLGKVNKLFKNKAKNVFYSFPISKDDNAVYSGNPVRFKTKLDNNGEKVVFVGGSGGSEALNDAAIHFANENKNIPCVLIAGKQLEKDCLDKVEKLSLGNIEVLGYTNDILDVYKEAKVIVCRSGAGTIYEIANLSIPAIFVPLPNSADDHQKKNAEFFEKEKASLLIEQGEGFKEALEKGILYVWNNDEKRINLKENIDILAMRECDKIISDKLTENFLEKTI